MSHLPQKNNKGAAYSSDATCIKQPPCFVLLILCVPLLCVFLIPSHYGWAQASRYAPVGTADRIKDDDVFSAGKGTKPDHILLDNPFSHGQDSADKIGSGDIFSIDNDPSQKLAAEMLPDKSALERPADSPLPLSGVPIAPWPGIAIASVPMVNAYEPKPGERYTGHLQNLDALSDGEAFSQLLSPRTDALRFGDLDDPYFVPTAGWGHVLPQIMPFRRKLQKKGITFTVAYKAEALGNFHGGERSGGDYVNEMDYNLNFDLGKMAGFRNWSVHMVMMDRAGRETAYDRVGEYNVLLQESYSLSGHKAFRLADLYAQKNLFHNKVDVAFGRMTLTHIFATSPLLCTFQTTCSAPAAIKADPGLSVYPKGSWGARVSFRPTRDTHFIIGAFQVYPTQGDPGGWTWGNERTTGLALPIEFTWTPFLTHNRLPGRYKFGFMHDTSNYGDVFGNPLSALKGFAHAIGSIPKHGSREAMNAFWIETEQMMYRLGGRNQMAGGYFMSGFVHNTPHVSTIDNQAYVGFSLNGLFKGRPRDRFGLLYSWCHISDRKRLGEMALINNLGADDPATALVLGRAYGTYGSLGPKVKGKQTTTEIIEAYYSIDAAPGIMVQPEFIYQINPGESHHIPDAAMVGMKVMANL